MRTIQDLADRINTYAGAYGWQTAGLGQFATYPVADLRPPQGAIEARWSGVAYLRLHSINMPQLELNPAIGEVVSPTGFERGFNNYRIIFQAGFSTVPEAIQEACAALAVSVYQARGLNANLQQENLGGYQYTTLASKSFSNLNLVASYGLESFRNHRVNWFRL